MKMGAMRRLKKDLEEIKQNQQALFSANPVDDDLYHWHVTIKGPPDSPYQDGIFFLSIKFPKDYPFRPPAVAFRTKIYHLNISSSGIICSDWTCHGCPKWSPAVSISALLLTICSLLSEPNPNQMYECKIAEVYKKDREKYFELAKEWTRKYGEQNAELVVGKAKEGTHKYGEQNDELVAEKAKKDICKHDDQRSEPEIGKVP